MKLILKKDVEALGEAGDVVDVKAGYGRNYLLPQGLAYEASEANLRRIEEEKERAEEKARREYLEARRRASQVEELILVFNARASDEGSLFGSVTPADIADMANERGLDFELDKKQVVQEEPIKELGVYRVPIRLHPEVETELEVRVEREGA